MVIMCGIYEETKNIQSKNVCVPDRSVASLRACGRVLRDPSERCITIQQSVRGEGGIEWRRWWRC